MFVFDKKNVCYYPCMLILVTIEGIKEKIFEG